MSDVGNWPDKTPAEEVLRGFDWTGHLLEGDSIGSSNWTATGAGLNLTVNARDGLITTIKVTDGTLGEIYAVTNTVVTAQGETLYRSAYQRVVELRG